MLRLEAPLPDLPDTDGRPELEKDVLRDPCSLGSGVVPREETLASVGETALSVDGDLLPKSKVGISCVEDKYGSSQQSSIKLTSLKLVCLRIITHKWGLGFSDFHETVFLDLC